MRNRFDEQLSLLNRELIQMGALCEEVIALAAKALTTGDVPLAAKVAPIDSEIDDMERSIETLALKLLLQQQPVARDLRQVSAALKMITDMERIGDQAADIAEIITFLDGRTGGECADIQSMAEATIKMVTESVDAFVNKDTALADTVIKHDDGEYALDLLMIAKYFERIGDHAVNIAEWVEFSVTGVHKGESEI